MGKSRLSSHILKRFLGLWDDRWNSLMLSYLNIAMFRYKSRPKCCSLYNDHSERFCWEQQNLWDIFYSHRTTYSLYELPSIWNIIPALPFSSAKWVFCWHQKVEIRKVPCVLMQAQRAIICNLFLVYTFGWICVNCFYMLIDKMKEKKE